MRGLTDAPSASETFSASEQVRKGGLLPGKTQRISPRSVRRHPLTAQLTWGPEQPGHAERGRDLGDADSVADHAVGSAASALAEDSARSREVYDVGDREEVVFVPQFGDEFKLVLDLRLLLGGDPCRQRRPAPS